MYFVSYSTFEIDDVIGVKYKIDRIVLEIKYMFLYNI